ncbi:hypothetical protein [Chitinimonas naiadis]
MTLVLDGKQINGGSIKLDSSAAGGNMQLSDSWIRSVQAKLPNGDPAKAAIEKALLDGSLKTAVAGVDKPTGKFVVVNVDANVTPAPKPPKLPKK